MDAIPAVIYAAKSSPDEKESTASQVVHVRERLAQLGGRSEVGEPFSEDNVSAFKGSRGPQLEAAMRAATAAVAEHGQAELWVYHSSRLARGSGTRAQGRSLMKIYADLAAEGVALRSVTDDEFLTNPMLVGIASVQNHKYSADLSAHVRRGKRGQFERGEHGGGPCWDGYRDVDLKDATGEVVKDGRGKARTRRVMDPEREPVIRRLWELLLDGVADAAVARTLNSEGHRTVPRAPKWEAQPWSRRRVQDTRTNPAYAGGVALHRGPDQEINWNGAHENTYVTREEWERIQALCASRDRAADGRPRGGRGTTRYALAKLARCNRCGGPMFAQTSPYTRKDGSCQRSYVCREYHGATGACDAPKVDAEKVDRAVIAHLDRLFIDFDAWLAELAHGAEARRAAVEVELNAALGKLDRLDDLARKLEDDYVRQVNAGNERAGELATRMLERTENQRRGVEREAEAHKAALADLERPSTDAMLDVYNDLRRSIRAGADDRSDGLRPLNDRLRGIFEEFRLDTVEDGVVGVLPVLREDVIERYGAADAPPVVVGREGAKPAPGLPARSPVALFATGEERVRPPALPVAVPLIETGNRNQA